MCCCSALTHLPVKLCPISKATFIMPQEMRPYLFSKPMCDEQCSNVCLINRTFHHDLGNKGCPMTFSQVIRERGVDASLFSGSAICEDGAYLTAISSPTLFGVSHPFLAAGLSGGSELLYMGTKAEFSFQMPVLWLLGYLLWFWE